MWGSGIERRNILRARTALFVVEGISRREARRSMRWLLRVLGERQWWRPGKDRAEMARSGQILELLEIDSP